MRLGPRRFAALALSVALHLAFLGALVAREAAHPPAPRAAPTPIRSPPVEFEVAHGAKAPRAQPGPIALPSDPARLARPAEPTLRPSPPKPRPALPNRAALATGPSARAPPSANPSVPRPDALPAEPSPSEPLASDRPGRALEDPAAFAPTTALTFRLGVGSAEGPGGGVVSRPADPTCPEAERAEEAHGVGERVRQLLADAQALGRVEMGVVPDHYGKMREALDAAVAEPPQEDAGKTAQRQLASALRGLVRGWSDGAARFGATGNPFALLAPPETFAGGPARTEASTRGALQSLDRWRDFVEGRFGSPLVALVEIRQGGDGTLLARTLVASSGLKAFDAFVMGAVGTAVPAVVPPPSPEGLAPPPMRSLWAFEGRVAFAAPLVVEGGETRARNALYLVFGGSFEETTGEVWVNKLDEPRLICHARLLAVH